MTENQQTNLDENARVPFAWIIWVLVGCASIVVSAVSVALYISKIENKADMAVSKATETATSVNVVNTDLKDGLKEMTTYLRSIDQRLARIEGSRSRDQAKVNE